jgi:biopolymer transport protein ExbD
LPKVKDGNYDFARLTATLVQVKKQLPDETKVIMNADAWVPYDVVIKAIDAVVEDENGHRLFPDVSFAAGVE